MKLTETASEPSEEAFEGNFRITEPSNKNLAGSEVHASFAVGKLLLWRAKIERRIKRCMQSTIFRYAGYCIAIIWR